MLISDAYAAEQRDMHKNERYGAASKKFAPEVRAIINQRRPATMLDYGAGKQALAAALKGVTVSIAAYDPGIPEISELPAGQFDMVACIDVLEHIEPECLDSVLQSVASKTGSFAFLTIHIGPAGKTLSDGRNAHLIQRPLRWWAKKLRSVFNIVSAGMHNSTTIIAICERPK